MLVFKSHCRQFNSLCTLILNMMEALWEANVGVHSFHKGGA